MAPTPPGGPGPSYPPLLQACYVIGVLFIVTLSSQLDRQLPSLLVGPLRAEFGFSDTACSLLHGYGMLLRWHGWASALVKPFWCPPPVR